METLRRLASSSEVPESAMPTCVRVKYACSLTLTLCLAQEHRSGLGSRSICRPSWSGWMVLVRCWLVSLVFARILVSRTFARYYPRLGIPGLTAKCITLR